MRTITAAFFATTLLVSTAVSAADFAAPLPAGKPAGTKQAALTGPSIFLVLLSAGIVIGGISLVASNGNGTGGVTTPTTTATSTTALP